MSHEPDLVTGDWPGETQELSCFQVQWYWFSQASLGDERVWHTLSYASMTLIHVSYRDGSIAEPHGQAH